MSLQDCIRKAGKALSRDDADAIMALVEGGVDEATAVDSYLSSLDQEVESVIAQAVEAGATVERPTTLNQLEAVYTEESKVYPMAPRDVWYSDADYEARGGQIVQMSPDQFLAQVKPLELDETAEDNIEDLINHIQSGRQLDPLKIYEDGKEDGRHRAIAAKRLGIDSVPIVVFGEKQQILQQSGQEPRDLVVVHNLSAENIKAAADLGALAAPSLATVRIGVSDFTSFGDITLVAKPSLIDPQSADRAKTFDADVYSPRQPRAEFKTDDKGVKAARELVADAAQDLQEPNYSKGIDEDSIQRDGHSALYGMPVVQYAYLKEIGKAPKPAFKSEGRKLPASFINKYKGRSVTSLVDDPAFDKAARELIREQRQADVNSIEDPKARAEYQKIVDARDIKQFAVADIARRVEDYGKPRKVDAYETRKKIEAKLKTKKAQSEFENWVDDNFKVVEKARLFKGFTQSGDRRYADYTIDNVVREMTRTVRGGEGFNYGAGSIRAQAAKQFKSIKQIQQSRDKIVSEADMQAFKDESQQELVDLIEELRPYYQYDADSFGYMDAAAESIGSLVSGGRIFREDFKDVPPEVMQRISDYIQKLRNAPTEYFETKLGRAVDFGEFELAIVPKNADKKAVQILRDAGVKIRRYDPKEEGSRASVLAAQKNVLFQEGEAQPRGTIQLMETGERIIRLGAKSDLSTFLHESGHLFLEMEKMLSAKYGMTENNKVLLEWLGVESFDGLTVEHHEKFAETFETYLKEGKSPSLALRNAFAAFARWLTQVYKSLTGLQRAELTPEIRQVMDRLLATEEEITEAAANPQYDQFFESIEASGMTPEQWQKYQEARQKQQDRASGTLYEKVIKQIQNRLSKDWKDEKAGLVDEEMERLSKTPLYQAISDLKTNKLDWDATLEYLGLEKPTGRLIGNVKKDGVDPALFADTYGFSDVRTMLQQMIDAPSLKKAADEAAQQRMIEKHGDILNDGTAEELAQQAMQNEKHIDVVLQEIRGIDPKRADINREYLKAEAKAMIARMTYSQIKPNRYYQAVIRAAKAAATATTKEDRLQAKLQQLANHYLYREALKARERMTKMRQYVKKAQTREYDTKQVDPGYANNIQSLAKMYDLRNGPEQIGLADQLLSWYQGQISNPDQLVELNLLDPGLVEALILRNDQRLQEWTPAHFNDMSYADLQGLYEMLRHMRYVGGKVSEAGRAEFESEKAKLIETTEENGGHDLPEKTSQGRFDRAVENWKKFWNSLASLRNLTRVLDGFDKGVGPAWEYIYKPIEDANNRRLDLQSDLHDKFKEELKKVGNLAVGKFGSVTVQTEDGRQLSWNNEARFMMALYWGTDSSREAIRQAWNLTDNDVMAILETLSADQLQMVNAVWKINESLWPDMSRVSVQLFGSAPPKLDSVPFVVNGVELTGGHMRLFYRSSRQEVKAEQKEGMNFASVMPTKAGSLHSRVGSGGAKVDLQVGNITRALDEAVHYIAFAETARKVSALFNSRALTEVIERKHGRGFRRAMLDNLEGILANRPGRESQPIISDLSRLLRRAATAKHLMYSIRNSVQQVSALPVALDEVGGGRFTAAAMEFMRNRDETVRMVQASSRFMRDRSSLINREARIALNKIEVSGRAGQMWKQFQEWGFTPQTVMDATFAYPVWLAKYRHSMELHNDERRAVSEADTAVAESVGSGQAIHLGGMFQMNQTEFVKLMTVFGSWFNNYYQRVYRATGGGAEYFNAETAKALFTMPALVGVLSAVLIADIPKDIDDPEEAASWVLANWGGFVFGMAPFFREMFAAWKGYTPQTALLGGAEQPARIYKEVTATITGKQPLSEGLVDIGKAVTTFVPIPGSGQVFRIADAYQEGTAEGLYQAIVEGPERNK